MTDIKTLKTWPHDAKVDQIQGKVVRVYERKSGLGRDGNSTVQNAEFTDATGEKIRLSVWNHPDLKPLENLEVVISSNGKRGGVSVNHNTFNGDTKIELKVNQSGTFQSIAVGGHQAPANTQTPAPASNGVKTQGNAVSGPSRLNGQTIGMAINNACANFTARGETLDPKQIYMVASALVKVALHMEAGNLHDLKKTEEPAQTPAPAPAGNQDEDVPF